MNDLNIEIYLGEKKKFRRFFHWKKTLAKDKRKKCAENNRYTNENENERREKQSKNIATQICNDSRFCF